MRLLFRRLVQEILVLKSRIRRLEDFQEKLVELLGEEVE
jgi:hypothetical protein